MGTESAVSGQLGSALGCGGLLVHGHGVVGVEAVAVVEAEVFGLVAIAGAWLGFDGFNDLGLGGEWIALAVDQVLGGDLDGVVDPDGAVLGVEVEADGAAQPGEHALADGEDDG